MYVASGFFTEHGKAWLSIEKSLYIWDFETGANLTLFNELETLILDIACVKKSDTIYDLSENHLLFVSTPYKMFLFPLQVDERPDGDSYEYTISAEIVAEADSSGIDKFVVFSDTKICCKSFDGALYEVRLIVILAECHFYKFLYYLLE